MGKLRESVGAIVAATVLAAITLFTFFTLREIGPESTLRRFHQDLALNRPGDISETLLEPLGSPASRLLLQSMATVYGLGAPEPRVARTERDSNNKKAYAVLLYRTASGGLIPVRWVLVRQKANWRIDAAATLQQTRLLNGG